VLFPAVAEISPVAVALSISSLFTIFIQSSASSTQFLIVAASPNFSIVSTSVKFIKSK
jgi:hypothetical protein